MMLANNINIQGMFASCMLHVSWETVHVESFKLPEGLSSKYYGNNFLNSCEKMFMLQKFKQIYF